MIVAIVGARREAGGIDTGRQRAGPEPEAGLRVNQAAGLTGAPAQGAAGVTDGHGLRLRDWRRPAGGGKGERGRAGADGGSGRHRQGHGDRLRCGA